VTRPGLALIHSPLVGPMTWRAVAGKLAAKRDAQVEAPSASAWQVAPLYYPSVAARIAAQLPASVETWVLVGHSAAGGLLPSVAAVLGDKAGVAVFVDAILPHPGRSWLDTAPPDLRAFLADAVRDDRAPPWHAWLPSGALERLLPDERQRRAFTGDIEPMPAGYLTEAAPQQTPNWPPGPCAYLQLSGAYADEAAEATARGWQIERLALHHLAMLSEPDKVAAAIQRLVARIEA